MKGHGTAECAARCDQEGSERKGQLSKSWIAGCSRIDSAEAKSQPGRPPESTSLERLAVFISSNLKGIGT